MRLIDADWMLEHKHKELVSYDTYDLEEMLECVPTVDTERHGHWNKCVYDYYKCSVCGALEPTVDDFKQPLYEDFCEFKECNRFCRICGAKMDEVTELEKPIESDQMTFNTFVTCAICMWSRDVGCGTYSCTNDKVKDKVHKGDYNCPEAKLKREP